MLTHDMIDLHGWCDEGCTWTDNFVLTIITIIAGVCDLELFFFWHRTRVVVAAAAVVVVGIATSYY